MKMLLVSFKLLLMLPTSVQSMRAVIGAKVKAVLLLLVVVLFLLSVC